MDYVHFIGVDGWEYRINRRYVVAVLFCDDSYQVKVATNTKDHTYVVEKMITY